MGYPRFCRAPRGFSLSRLGNIAWPRHISSAASVPVARNQRGGPVWKPHIPAPTRHHFVAVVAEEPICVVAGVHPYPIAVPVAIVTDSTKAARVKQVPSHVGCYFGNLRRSSAMSGKPNLCAHSLIQQAGKSCHPLSLDNSPHVIVAHLKLHTLNRKSISPFAMQPFFQTR